MRAGYLENIKLISLMNRIGYSKTSATVPKTLVDSMPSIKKHRELTEEIEKHTELLAYRPWIKNLMLDMDEYLLRLFRTVHTREDSLRTGFALDCWMPRVT